MLMWTALLFLQQDSLEWLLEESSRVFGAFVYLKRLDGHVKEKQIKEPY
jgi:hypothetical protein